MEKIIHQIWVGPFNMPRRCAAGVEQIKAAHPDFEHRFWTDSNVPAMAAHVDQAYKNWMQQGMYAFAADVLRMWVVHLHGGVYLDVDFVCLEGLSGLRLENHEVFLCNHAGEVKTFPNGVFGMTKGCSLAQAAVDSIHPVHNICDPTWFATVVRRFLKVADSVNYEELRPLVEARGWLMISYECDFHVRRCRHDALASWFPENRQKLADGGYDVQE